MADGRLPTTRDDDARGTAGRPRPTPWLAAACAALLAATAARPAEPPAAGQTNPGPNVALGKTYTLRPAPNYAYCTEAGDATQLTDGVRTSGYFWTQKTTVGWQNARPVAITLDLEQVEPIAGLAFGTAAGIAQVTWPETILVLASDDGTDWFCLGDLVRLAATDGLPPAQGYTVKTLATTALKGHGRYVRLLIAQTPYCFCDEIEVYAGPEAWRTLPPQGELVATPESYFEQVRTRTAIRRRLAADLAAARTAVEALPPAVPAKPALLRRADTLATAIDALPEAVPPGFRTVLPLHDTHAAIYALNAPILRARNLGPLTLWTQCRWDPLAPTEAPEAPPATPPELRIDLMRNEYRAEVLNLTNATDDALPVTLAVDGLPGGRNPAWVRVQEVQFTDTASMEPVATALPDAPRGQDGLPTVTVPAGLTRQVWFTVHPGPDIAHGTHRGTIRVRTAAPAPIDVAVPFTVCVRPLGFPARPTLSLGGWDYTDGDANYYRAPGNLDPLLANLRAHYVDTPWGTAAVQPAGARFDPDGHLLNPEGLDTGRWDAWVERWAGARQYYVFLAVGDTFHGERCTTPRFRTMVGDWMRAWVAHLRTQKLTPGQLGLLLIDEPTSAAQDATILAWAEAIRAAEPEVVIWEDACHDDPDKATAAMFAACTTLCPQVAQFVRSPQAFRDFYLRQQQAGRRLWFYSCSGPAPLLDPYAYHRGQEWLAIRYGALGCGFWAFGCGGGTGNSWNAYGQAYPTYSPFFVAPDSVTDAKHWEAVREGVQDYEYFAMLRSRVAELDKQGQTTPALTAARRLLEDGPREVTATLDDKSHRWSVPKDRTVMDRVRVQALDALESLRTP